MKKFTLLCLVVFVFIQQTKAQTTLAAGDILFTGYNSIPSAGTTSDTFTFIVLTPITTGTVIYFTDRGYQGGVTWQGSGGTEGTIAWTVGSALTVGKEVKVVGYTATVNSVTNGTVVQVAGGNATTGLSLGNTGDQLMAFQGASGDPTSGSAVFICGISWQFNCGSVSEATWNGSGCTYGPQSSLMPPGLASGVSALLTSSVAVFSSGFTSHGRFECNGAPFANVAAIKAALLNRSNWTFSANTTTTEIAIPAICTFTSTSTTWNGTTWSNSAPSSSIDAIIASSTAPSNFTCKTLTINSGVALTTTGIIATVNGGITNNGNGIAGTGGLTIAANSTISGSNINFNGTLIVNTGATLITNDKLTLSSNSTNTGKIGNSAGTISGNITVQRFIPAKATRRFSFISSPVSQALSAAWQQQVHITGAGSGGRACGHTNGFLAHTNGFDATVTNAPSMYSYDASLTANNRWTANTTGTTGFNLTPGKGYRLNVRGPRTTGCSLLDGTGSGLIPAAVTLSATGAVNNASKNAGSFTNTYNNNVASNYVLIGNPYPCELDFSAFRTTNSSIIGSSYVLYDPQNAPNLATPANMYSTWNTGTWSNAATGISNANGQYIANGQAFFVQATAASNITLSFNEAHKYSGTQNGVFRTRNWNDLIRIGLNKDNVNIDNTVIRYTNENGINNTNLNDLDASLLSSSEVYLGSRKGNSLLSIQTRTLQDINNDTVAIDFNTSESGSYALNFSEYENCTAATGIYLVDSYTKTIHDVKSSSIYNFTVDKNNAATQTNRFALVFNRAIPLATITGIKVYPNPADKNIIVQLPQTEGKYTVTITEIAGKKIYQSQLASGTQTINIANFTKGNYVVEIIDTKGNRAVEKLVKQ